MHALNKLEEGGSTAASSKRHEQQFRLDLMPLQRITPTVAAAAADALELVPGYMATPSADSPFSAFGRACEDWHYGPDERPDPYLRPDSAMRQMAGSRASRGSRESHGDRPLSRNRVGTGGGLESYDYATREDLMAKGWVAPFGAAVVRPRARLTEPYGGKERGNYASPPHCLPSACTPWAEPLRDFGPGL